MNEKPFECAFCGKQFVFEVRYLNHKCDKMQRREDIKSVLGQTAYSLYQLWFTTKKKTAPSVEAFLNSKQYKPFFKFAEFIKRLKISEPELFVRMMNEKNILPAHWTNDEMYAYYLEYLDRKLTPKQQASITIRMMEKITVAADCDMGDVFNVLQATDIIQLIRERKFSPWILLRSRKFMTKFELMTKEEQRILESLIRFEYWKQKFQNRMTDKQYMDRLVKDMDL
jgi:hypothetical protein